MNNQLFRTNFIFLSYISILACLCMCVYVCVFVCVGVWIGVCIYESVHISISLCVQVCLACGFYFACICLVIFLPAFRVR